MGKLVVVISDELEQRFREEVFKRYGLKKGNLSKAMEEAIKIWISQPGKTKSKKSKG